MSLSSKVIVIGAGIGGIVAAARLARLGYAVTVLEKNAAPGGRCEQFWRAGHRFDVGPTLFLMPEVFAQSYADLGECMQDHLDLRRIDPTYHIHFTDGSKLALTSDLNDLQSQLEALEPGSFSGLLRYLVEGRQNYRGALDHFVGRNFYNLFEYFSPANLPYLFKMKALVKHYDNIGRYFHHPRLKAAFTFQNMYLGLSPFDAPATYSLLQYTELADGVWYPIGGLNRVVESLVQIAVKLGVEFVFQAPVEQIVVEANRARGVVLEDGRRFAADLVLANADLPYVYSQLLPSSREARRLEKMQYTSSAIMFYWGADCTFPQLATHNVFLSDDFRGSFERIFKTHDLPEEPSFYVHAPTRVDPEAAPPGEDTLFVLVPVGHLDGRANQDWDCLHWQARAAVLARLAQLGLEDLEAHLKFEVSYTPKVWQKRYNLAKGAAFSLSHNFSQVGYLRPHNRHSRYHNLYFVGGSTHPGTGLPIVLLSARLVTERIVKEWKNGRVEGWKMGKAESKL